MAQYWRTQLDRQTAIDELRRYAELTATPLDRLTPRALLTIGVRLGHVLDLTDAETRKTWGLGDTPFGVSHQYLTLVLSGHRVASRRLRACIAVYAGLHIKAVPRTFSPLYDPPEIRHPRRRRRSTYSDDET